MRRAHRAALGLLLLAGPASAGGPPAEPCEPGYQWVEEDSVREVVRYVCKVVPTVKKVRKVVYTTKDDPFCLPGCSLKSLSAGGCDGAEGCASCKGPYPRKILIKTEITTDEPGVQCVVERVVEQVPCKVRRKVPITAAPVLPTPAGKK